MLPVVEKNDKSIFLDAHRLLWSRICLWLRNLNSPITVQDFDDYKRGLYIDMSDRMPIYDYGIPLNPSTCCFLCDYGRDLSCSNYPHLVCDFCPAYIMAQWSSDGCGCLQGLYGALRNCIRDQEYSDAYYIAVLIRDTPFCSFSKENNKTDYEEIVNYLYSKGGFKKCQFLIKIMTPKKGNIMCAGRKYTGLLNR